MTHRPPEVVMNDKARPPIRVLVIDDEAPVIDAYQQIFAAPPEDVSARKNLGAKLFGRDEERPSARLSAGALKFDVEYRNGAELGVAAVQDALQSGRPFAVAFVDMRMGAGPDGVWAASRIRELDPAME